jgi:hypothetical protein
MTVSALSDPRMGLMTATGFPRSVNSTSSPPFTAFTALENRWLASRNPMRIGMLS